MNIEELQAALSGLGVSPDNYVLRVNGDINDSASFISCYNVVTGTNNGNNVESSDKSLIPVTWDQITAKDTELKSDANKVVYKQQRLEEYPNFGEQLDYIYHHGIDKWKTDIVDPVKTKYPKPS
mgnify:FL=1